MNVEDTPTPSWPTNEMVPIGRQALSEGIAAAATFLAFDDASYITGDALVVDGGLTAVR